MQMKEALHMDGWFVVLLLFAIAVALWVASYFVKEPEDQLQEEFEEVSLNLLQDIHVLKKRLETMEQEMDIEVQEDPTRNGRVMEITKRHVLTLYTKGTAVGEIVEQINLPEAAVQDIIDDYITESL